MPLPGGTTNFGDVEQFESLGEGEFEGHIEYIRFKDGSARGKADQLSVCLVSDEEATQGEKAWQNLYLTAKALYRTGQFFALFGITEIDWDNGLSAEEPFDLIDPDLTGEPARFRVERDPQDYKGKPSYKTEVIEWLGGQPAPKAAPAKAAPVADSTEEGGEDPDAEAPAAPARRTFTPGAKAPAAAAKAPARKSLR